MPAKKAPVSTPLHLLQELSHSLVSHLQKACSEAQRDAEMLLAKLEKQRGKIQEKIVKARAALDEAGNAGKAKAQAKARSRLAELDDMLGVLQARQSETLSYLSDLKRDAEQSMKLAQGVAQVERAAAQALSAREKGGEKVAPAQPRSRSKAPAKAHQVVDTNSDAAAPAVQQAGEMAGAVKVRAAAKRRPATASATSLDPSEASPATGSAVASSADSASASPEKAAVSKRAVVRKPSPARRKPATQSSADS